MGGHDGSDGLAAASHTRMVPPHAVLWAALRAATAWRSSRRALADSASESPVFSLVASHLSLQASHTDLSAATHAARTPLGDPSYRCRAAFGACHAHCNSMNAEVELSTCFSHTYQLLMCMA